jgi:glycerol-3-phosphate dehydrogenase
MAQTLVDVLERRTRLAFFATESARIAAPTVATIVARELVADFTRQCEARLAWRTAPQGQKENR